MPGESNNNEEKFPLHIDTSHKTYIMPSSSLYHILPYTTVFFLVMIAHKVALEARTREFIHVPGLLYLVTIVQFGYCFLLPVIVTKGQVLKCFPMNWLYLLMYVKLMMVVYGGTALVSQSIVYVTYPTKVMFKSTKLIPTMIISTCWNNTLFRCMTMSQHSSCA